ncbi:MAG TPA: glycosyltransferase family 87 protein [Terriglobales bacterium]|nr:glycosyltransferase family 87 protein [Terriglobales bacterium]
MRFRPRPVVIFSLLIILASTYFFFGIFIPGLRPGHVAANRAGGYGFGNDLYPIWVAGGELFDHRDPYAAELTARIETGLYGRPLDRRTAVDAAVNYRAFSYPVYTIFIFAPIVPLSFPTVQVVLAILLPFIAALTVVLWLRTLDSDLTRTGTVVAVCLALASYPALEGVYSGQPGLISAAIIAGTLALLVTERFVLAGILLPWASIKPQLVLLVALWLVLWSLSGWSQRKRFFFSFSTTGLAILAASFWVTPNWIGGWMHALREYRQLSPLPLAQFVLGRYLGIVASLGLLLLSLAVCWRERRQPPDSEGFTLATTLLLAVTVLTLPSTIAVYDQFLLLPAVLWLYTYRERILRGSRALRLLTVITIAAVSWQWIAAGALVALHWLSPSATRTPASLLLPYRTAASVPFAITALISFLAMQKLRDPGRSISQPRSA